MARKNQHKPQATPPPVNKDELTFAFVGAVDLLRRQWDTLFYIFLADVERHRAMKAFAPKLFDSATLAFTVMVYLEIAKLHDPVTSMNQPNKRNLVLRRVIDELAPPVGSPERNAIEANYTKIQPVAEKVKQWRNSVGAHKDLLTSLAVMDHILNQQKPHPIPFISLTELANTVAGIVAITDAIVAFRAPSVQWYEADAILRDVQKCVEVFRVEGKDALKPN